MITAPGELGERPHGALGTDYWATEMALSIDPARLKVICYRPRYLNIQRLNYLWTIRHSSARIAGNLVT